MDDARLLEILHAAADDVGRALGSIGDWGLADTVPGQHHSDLAADEVAVAMLVQAGLGVLSEESGLHHPEREVVVVVDPLDGSTNASRQIPWYATSLCAVDAAGPRAAVVVDMVHQARFEAVRGGGARRNGDPLSPSTTTEPGHSLVAVNGLPHRHLGWEQFRALGAAALDLCAVASGQLDAFVDCTTDTLGPWDYLGGMLVCLEAGAVVVDAGGRDLVVLQHDARRTPIAAATPALASELLANRMDD